MAPATRRIGRALCIAEFGIAMVLLVGAALLGRSLFALVRTDIGVDPDGVTVASLRLGSRERREVDVVAHADRLVARARAQPGVDAAGVGAGLPPRNPGLSLTLKRKGDTVDYAATALTVGPGYMEALGFRLLAGRFFEPADDAERPQVVIMSDATARGFFGDQDPIGRTLTLPTLRDGVKGSAEMTVVGVVAPVRYAGLAAEADEQVYRPFAQQPWGSVFLVARAPGGPADIASGLRRSIAAVDPGVPVVAIQSLETLVSEETSAPRMRSLLLGAIAFLGVTVAAVGLYGVVAYSVSQRTAEIAVRMALGARHRDLARMVLKEGLVLGLAGTALGLAGAWSLARSMRALVFPMGSADPVSYALSGGLLLVIAVVASYVPARRASRVEPVVALRAE
jgi:putative ABC transport system permease protein